MPFFLSQKRNTGAPRGTQQQSTDYVRAAPSAFRYYPYTVIHLSLFIITRFLASCFAMAQIAYTNKNKTVVSMGKTKTTFPKDIWGIISGYLYQYMQQDEGQGATTGDQKRGRDDGEEGYEEGEIPTAPKKKKKFNPFEV